MGFLKKIMSTQVPAVVIFPRLFVASVAIVDAVRGWASYPELGFSAITHLSITSMALVKVACVAEFACAALIVAGYLTRLAILPVLALWTFEAFDAWAQLQALGTARVLDRTLLAVGMVSVSLLLLARGPGIWSVDASLSQFPHSRPA